MKTRGIATLEILIAMTIMVLAIGAVTQLSFGSQSTSIGSQTSQEALYKAQAAIESARATARANFSDPNLNPGTYTTTDSSGITYTKKLTVTSVDDFTKNITSFVSWGNGQYVTLATNVTDWKSALGGDTCSPTLSGDWTAPQVYGYFDFPSSAGATAVNITGSKAYITSDPSAVGTDDFYIVDVSNPNLKPLPKINSFSTTYGLTDVAVAGHYAYVTAHSAKFQLLVIDITDPTSLGPSNIVGKSDMTLSGDTAYGNTLFYANKKVYVGLIKSDGPEFHIFDVSDPTNPNELGSGFEVSAAINRILVKNNTAYIATASTSEVIALDVTNPASPTQIGVYTSLSLTGQSLVLDSKSDTLYFGKIGGIGNPKLLALDNTSLATPPKWTMDLVKQSGVYTLILRSNLLFMTTADPNDGLQIWDVSKANSTTPPIRYDTAPLNIQQNATAGTDCSGNLLYVAQKSNRGMQIIGPYIPPFTYSLSNSLPDISLTHGGSSVNQTVLITMNPGATPEVVTLTPDNPASTDITINPSSAACTPSATSPYTCSVTFSYSAGVSATKKTYNNQGVGGEPNSMQTNKYKISVN